MNKTLRIILIVFGILVVAAGLVYAGTWIGRRAVNNLNWPQPAYRMMNPGRGFGPGMMDGYGGGMMNPGRGFGPGMMGSYANNPSTTPLTIEQAYQSAEQYLAALDNPDLKIAEVMVFDNNAYVRVVEQSTGIGAFELLVDPTTQIAYPEHGPNMMWNLKYSGLNHQQMGGRMMGYSARVEPGTVSAEMPVSSAQALQIAQRYLDTAQPGSQTAADADPFYGYYTIDILRDGKTVGMLSVNGFSGQVFLHTWHGAFIDARDY